jgi:Histidine kinase-, DNA gyrase B-, and HSP90-like ATPase
VQRIEAQEPVADGSAAGGRAGHDRVDDALATLPAIAGETTAPDPGGTAEAFAQSGYRFENAIADLVDNSIDAGARTVVIRFITDARSVRRIVVGDDGGGMDESRLREAMRYGGRFERRTSDLGKYGVGMKSASLSQCRSLSVISRRNGQVAGRRWTEESIKNGWTCEVLDPKAAARMADMDWGHVKLKPHGTLVVWDGLDRLRSERDGVEAYLTSVFKLLRNALGLTFHRFLKSDRFRIVIDRIDAATWQTGLASYVEPLDPFGYKFSGAAGYPRTFSVDLGDGILVDLRAHVWPPNDKSPEYRLGGGRVASRQGFFFYRNRRLIQAGGWNGWRDSDNEPHFSLARVAVDLPTETDRTFGLSLHKSTIDAPPRFLAALDHVRTDGSSFKDYIRVAEGAYRSAGSAVAADNAIPLPGLGISPAVKAEARKLLAGKDRNVREFRFRWVTGLPASLFFNIDFEDDVIELNDRYRKAVLAGGRGSANDAPLLKALLFMAVRPYLTRERMSKPMLRELLRLNRLLTEAAEQEGQ